MSDIDIPLFDEALAKYPDFIIGIKVRMSRSVVGDNGIKPLLKAKKMQKKSRLPLMIHVGNNPPELDEIADLLSHGRESFCFAVAERAKCFDIYPNAISSDIYSKNRLQGPVWSLANVMTKFICLGYSKQRIIDSVTNNSAEILH